MGQWTVEEPKNVKWFDAEKTSNTVSGYVVYNNTQNLHMKFRVKTLIGRTAEDKVCFRIAIEGSTDWSGPIYYSTVITPCISTSQNDKGVSIFENASKFGMRPGGDLEWFPYGKWDYLTVGGTKKEADRYVYYIMDNEPTIDELKAGAVHSIGRATNTYSIPQHYGNQLWLPTSDGWKRAQLWIPVDGTWKMGFFKPRIEGDWK